MKKNILIFSLVMLGVQNLSAVTWYWRNGAADNVWNTTSQNFEDADLSTTANPAAGDSVVFDGTITANCTLSVSTNALLAINIASGYTGRFVKQTYNITTTGNFEMADGFFEGGSAAMTIGGLFIHTGGNFTATTGNTIIDGSTFTSSAGAFSASTGKFFFRINSGGSNKTINSTRTFNNVEFRNFSGVDKTYTITDATTGITINGLITIYPNDAFAGITFNTGIIHAKDGITFSGGLITSSGGTATIIIDGTADQSITTANTSDNTRNLPNVTINKASGTAILIASSRLNTTGDFTIQGGTFRIVDQLVDGDGGVSDDFIVQSGGTLEYSTATIYAPTGFNSFSLNAGSTVAYTLDGASSQTILDLDYSNLTLSAATIASAKILPATSTVTVTGTFTINTNATLDMNTNGEDISIFALDNNNTSDWVSNTSNTITFTGSSAATIDDAATGTVTYGNVIFSNSHALGTRLNTIAGTPEFGSVTISASGLFDPDAVNFNIKGAWTNNSALTAFIPSAGQTVNFNGGGAQSLTGSASTKFQRVRISAASTAVTISSSNCQIAQSLDLENDASLTTGGLLTLLSDGNGTAGIEVLSDEGNTDINHISGLVTCQRYVNESASAKYHALASPTTDATFNEWLDDTYVTGITGSDDAGQTFKSIKHWDEAAIAYSSPATMGTSIPNGADQSGFLVYMGSDSKQAMPKTMDVSGTVRSRTQDVTINNLSYTAGAWPGYHLLGNPWPGAFSWGAAQTNPSNSNINQVAYKLKKSAGSPYTYWNMDAADGTDVDTVESGEAFWVVVASGTNRIDFQENDKIAQGGYDSYNLKHANTTVPKIGITLQQGTFESAPIWIKFANSSLGNEVTRDFDSLVDGVAFTNGANDIATVVGNKNFAVNYLPDSINSISVPVRIWKNSPTGILKTYIIKFTKVAELSAYNKCLSFEDTYAGVSFPLTGDTSYTVSMKDTTYVPRFFVHISSPLVSSVTNIGCNGNAGGIITATGSGTGPFDYLWKNQAGDTLRNISSSVTDTLSNLQAGIYFLTVSNNGSCGTVSDHFEIIQPEPIALALNQTNATCFGDSSGTADVSASGGTGTYSYLWSNGQSQSQISNLKSQIYFVTVTDDGNCSIVDSVSISQPSAISLSSVAMNLACYGDSNGTATAFVSGGNSPYTFVWSNGATDSQISNLTSQIYFVTMTDNNSCTKIDSVELTQPEIITVVPSTVDVACNGDSTGQASVSVAGGISPYSYSWNTGAGTQNISSLAPGIFSVTVMDANNCSQTNSVTINQPILLSLTASSTDALCYGGNDGIASVSVSGGTSAYSYLWSNGNTQSQISNLTSQIYYVTVTDSNNCTSATSISINQPDFISLSISSTGATCNNGNNGQAWVTAVSGGVPNYSYLWSSGGTSASESGLEAGSYTLSVTDNNNCVSSVLVIISEPTPVLITPSSVDATCGNANGSATVSASGGTGNLDYLWNNGSQAQSISSIAAGTYFVTVTDDNNCSSTSSILINNINGPTVSIVSSSDVSCNGGNNGMASSGISGGTSPFTYLWSNGAVTDDLQGVVSDTYFVSVTDGNNCIGIGSVTINEPTMLAMNTSPINISCNGGADGQISVAASGGTSPYFYLWPSGGTSNSETGLSAGTYFVTVTDNNGCTFTTSSVISEPAQLTTGASSVSVLCFGNNDGQVNTSVSGGISPYSFLWNNGAQTSDLTSLVAGDYSVTVTDYNNCSAISSVTINEPVALTTAISPSDASCGNSDGSVSLNATGGTGILSFLWSNGSVTQNISTLPAGTYSVTVTDENACSASISAIVNDISGPDAVISSYLDVTCNGGNNGQANASVSGGSPDYSYAWSNGGNDSLISNLPAGIYFVSVTDNIGCVGIASVIINEPAQMVITVTTTETTCGYSNGSASLTSTGGTGNHSYSWSTGDTSNAISNIGSGSYSYTVTDANNCQQISSASVNNIAGPAVNFLSSSDVSCNAGSNGQVTTNSTGGTAPYSYLWSTGTTNSNISGVPSGIYTLTVTDANNCVEVLSVTINQPDAIIISATGIDALCGNSDGSATIIVSGGAGGYSYSWSNGESTQAVSNLAAGNYYVLVSDANGCTKMATVSIDNIAGPSVNIQVVDEPSCYGLSDGSATLNSSGNGPFAFLWQNSTGDTLQFSSNIISSDILQNLSSGNYSVLVSDNNGCGSTLPLSINQPGQVIAAFAISEDTVDIGLGGLINLTNSSSGANAYSWNFGDGSVSTQFEPAHAFTSVGAFTISLTAAMGQCSDENQQTIVVINSVGIAEVHNSDEIVLYQAGNMGIIQYNFSGPEKIEVGIFNILGQQVVPVKNFLGQNGSLEIKLPVETGVYFMKVRIENREQILKVVH